MLYEKGKKLEFLQRKSIPKNLIGFWTLTELRYNCARVRRGYNKAMASKKASLVMKEEKVEVDMKEFTMSELQHFIFEHFLQKQKWNDDMKLEIKDEHGRDIKDNASVASAFDTAKNVCFTLKWIGSSVDDEKNIIS
ncbi:hypothetical protein RFI_05198, partial [Reticulomyxa filosa]